MASTSPQRPEPLPVVSENIPAELKRLRQWIVWKYEFRDKWTKPPYQVNGTDRASATDPSTWAEFKHAFESYQKGQMDGIGFVLTAETGFVGIDLDRCFDSTARRGELWANDIVQTLGSSC